VSLIGLLAFVIEQRHDADEFVPARLTVDMFRLPTLAPIEVTTKLIRDGLRIKLVEAEFFSGGVTVAIGLRCARAATVDVPIGPC
jgi:hypothetical protein